MPFTYTRRNVIGRLFLVAASWLLLLVPVPYVRLFPALLFLCFLPAAPSASRTSFSFTAGLAITTGLSPVFLGVLVLLLLVAGAGSVAVWIALAIFSLAYLVFGSEYPRPSAEEKKSLLVLVVIFAAVASITFYLPLTRLWWRVRADSWFHAAVLNRLSAQGLPLEDPYFSPLRLQYMYFYHILLLCAKTLVRTGPFFTMIFLNVVALGSLVLGFAFLARLFAKRAASRALALWVLLLGMNGLFFLFFPIRIARAFLGTTRGTYMLKNFFSLSPPGHERAMAFLSIEGNQFIFLDKFMLGTALSLALGLLCVFLGLYVTLERKRRLHAVLLVCSLFGLLLLHLVIGLTVFLATLGTSLVFVLFYGFSSKTAPGGLKTNNKLPAKTADTDRPGGSDPRYDFELLPHNLVLSLAAMSFVLAFPYIYSILPRGGAGSSAHLAVQGRRIIGLLSDVLPAALLSLPLVFSNKSSRARPPALAPLFLWSIIVALAAVFVDLPTNNETKFAFILFIPLCAVAAGGIDLLLRKRKALLIAFIFLSTVPLNAIYFSCAFQDKTSFTLTNDERALYSWITTRTEKDALFLEDHDIVRIPVLASRDLYWGNETYARVWGYPKSEMEKRRALRDLIFSDSPIEPSDFDDIVKMRRPFYIICRTSDPRAKEAFEKLEAGGFFETAFSAGEIYAMRLAINNQARVAPKVQDIGAGL